MENYNPIQVSFVNEYGVGGSEMLFYLLVVVLIIFFWGHTQQYSGLCVSNFVLRDHSQ